MNTDFEREINKTDNIDVLRERVFYNVFAVFSLVRGSQYYEINFMYRWCVELFRREKFVFS